jgi:hypothetical protein
MLVNDRRHDEPVSKIQIAKLGKDPLDIPEDLCRRLFDPRGVGRYRRAR